VCSLNLSGNSYYNSFADGARDVITALTLIVAQYCFYCPAARRVTRIKGAAVAVSASRLRLWFGPNLDKPINNLNDLVDQQQRDD